MKSFWAKFFGWAQFGLVTAGQLFSSGVPHGWHEWIALAASGAMAVATHHAAGTDGTK